MAPSLHQARAALSPWREPAFEVGAPHPDGVLAQVLHRFGSGAVAPLLAGISRRLHGLVHDVEAYALHTGPQRVIGYLLRDQQAEDCVSGDVITVSIPVSKATIASRLSLTPEYFSRVLHELEAAGLIEVDKRDIQILDAKRLASYRPV